MRIKNGYHHPWGQTDDPTRERLKAAATSIDRTPHWLIKQAIFNYLEKLEGGATLTELNGLTSKDADDAGRSPCRPRAPVLPRIRRKHPAAVGAARRDHRRLPSPGAGSGADAARAGACRPPMAEATNKLAASIADNNQKAPAVVPASFKACCRSFPVVPGRRGADVPGRSAAAHSRQGHARRADPRQDQHRRLAAHLGNSPSLFVNAATWGLLLTGKLVTHSESGLTSSLSRMIGKAASR
jgi:RHH-type proline utilization regulon transcriptional repressor/proline dehydrogenase/delta 1-pyrroline-5-carboxylate dehydrogenase